MGNCISYGKIKHLPRLEEIINEEKINTKISRGWMTEIKIQIFISPLIWLSAVLFKIFLFSRLPFRSSPHTETILPVCVQSLPFPLLYILRVYFRVQSFIPSLQNFIKEIPLPKSTATFFFHMSVCLPCSRLFTLQAESFSPVSAYRICYCIS